MAGTARYHSIRREKQVAEIRNLDGNVVLRLCLIDSKYTDIQIGRDDRENWIAFTLLLKVESEVYEYPASRGATLSLYESRELVSHLADIVARKTDARTFDQPFTSYEYYSSEGYFSLTIEDVLEEHEVGVDVWLDMGALTAGEHSGYERGYRFTVDIDAIAGFTRELEAELQRIQKQH